MGGDRRHEGEDGSNHRPPVCGARHRVAVARRVRRERRLGDTGPGDHRGDLGRPLRTQPGEGLFRAVHERDGNPGRNRAIQRRACRAAPAAQRRRHRVGSGRHDDGRQSRRLQARPARAHRPLVARARARRHACRRGLRRWRADRVRRLADRLRHGDGVQPRGLSGRASGPDSRHLRPAAIPRKAGAAEAARSESRMGAQVLWGCRARISIVC